MTLFRLRNKDEEKAPKVNHDEEEAVNKAKGIKSKRG